MIEGLVRRISEEAGVPLRVISTGGLSSLIAEMTSSIDVHDPLLTLKGLKSIYYKNERVTT